MTTVTVPFEYVPGAGVVIEAKVNGHDCPMLLDTGDALGPTFNGRDMQQFGLVSQGPIGISGAGGPSQAYGTTATVEVGGVKFENEAGAIDLALQGISLLGLPWFKAKTEALAFDFKNNVLVFEIPDPKPAKPKAKAKAVPATDDEPEDEAA